GKTGRIEVVDQQTGSWGNIGLDDVVFSDHPMEPVVPLASEPDFGTMVLALLDSGAGDSGNTSLSASSRVFSERSNRHPSTKPFGEKLVGGLSRKLTLKAGASGKVTFALAWHMPNLKLSKLPPGRHYAQRFGSAVMAAGYLAQNFDRLSAETRLWHDTWYDSTLPYWFLDRTFLNTSILATSTCYRLGTGRVYAWEGVGCCEGTCGHVWQYAHAMARLFPELERITREHVDFGLALQPDGAIHFRGEFNDFPAIDAQAGAILRALREHQISPDDAFLRRIWSRVKLATEWLLAKDANGDGLIESNQHNTLDTDWFGPVAWLSGLYLAALEAAATMARQVGDAAFESKCREVLEAGKKKIVAELFDGEYFINKPDSKHLDAINSGSGCEIDQVFGQSWAFQVGLPRVLPERETVSALKSLWRYNFTPDVGPYRKVYKPGRWYAMPGEAGLLMCTFPRADWDYSEAKGKGPDWAAGYFNECMNGFEYQAAGHMLWEGLLTEGLAVTRAVHDRYHASRRNPWNEIECGDHYARSMASYGVFLAACGFEDDGPAGHLGFAPRLLAKDAAADADLFK
ncbi:MAG: GH116 family glycosyl hydrolase, partial [Limisphaerales bacterium]